MKIVIRRVLLVVLLLQSPSAFADSYTLDFLSTTGPAPTSAGFEYDPATSRFLSPVRVRWDIVPEFTIAPSTFALPELQGCPGPLDQAWFRLLTGDCGPLTYQFSLMYEYPQFHHYEAWVGIRSAYEFVVYFDILFNEESVAGYFNRGSGTVMGKVAQPLTVAQPLPVSEPSSIILLLSGLGMGLGVYGNKVRRTRRFGRI